MGTIFFLILFPIVVAILLLVLKADAARDIIVKIAALAIAAASIDRKSTRLNSSHASISYAVFCLKKKIDIIYPQVRDRSPCN